MNDEEPHCFGQLQGRPAGRLYKGSPKAPLSSNQTSFLRWAAKERIEEAVMAFVRSACRIGNS